MYTDIFEELPTPSKKPAPSNKQPAEQSSGVKNEGGADQKEKMEKRVRQAVYDIRYRARREDIPLAQAYTQYMSNTTMTGPEKAAVKGRLAESYEMNELATTNVAGAMYKVFVEGLGGSDKIEDNDYLNQLMEMDEKKYKVRVTDKSTKRSYVRYATREKINQLRSNPNISSVEMTEYGTPYEGEKEKGEQTAKTKSGKGLDPVGKEDKDIDNDGDHDKTDKYLLHRRKVRGSAIASRNESFDLNEVKSTSKQNKKKVTGEGVDNYKSVVKLFPDDGEGKLDRFGASSSMSIKSDFEMNGVVIAEKAVSTSQQKFMGMVLAAKKGKKPASPEVASAAKEMTKGEVKKFAKTKHKGLPTHVEETECSSKVKNKDVDPREMPTKVNLIKNKMRAMGLKMSYEPEGEVIDELRRSEKEGKGSPERREGPYLVGVRKQNKERGEKGGRRWQSGGEGGSRSERGKKKNDPGSQHQRLNPPEKKGRQLERGTKAATERAYGYGQGRNQGD